MSTMYRRLLCALLALLLACGAAAAEDLHFYYSGEIETVFPDRERVGGAVQTALEQRGLAEVLSCFKKLHVLVAEEAALLKQLTVDLKLQLFPVLYR